MVYVKKTCVRSGMFDGVRGIIRLPVITIVVTFLVATSLFLVHCSCRQTVHASELEGASLASEVLLGVRLPSLPIYKSSEGSGGLLVGIRQVKESKGKQ